MCIAMNTVRRWVLFAFRSFQFIDCNLNLPTYSLPTLPPTLQIVVMALFLGFTRDAKKTVAQEKSGQGTSQ